MTTPSLRERMPRHPTPLLRNCVVLTILVVASTACAKSSAVSDGRGSSLTALPLDQVTAPPPVTAPPASTVVPAETEAPPTTEAATAVAAQPASTVTGTVPETTVPETTVPETVPETTVPETTVPETTVPEALLLLVPAPPPAQLVLAIGSQSGDGTRVVQQRLLELGFWLSGVDGDYGLTTKQAVMAFQKYNALPATGKVDQVTADALTYSPFRARGVSHEGSMVEINKALQLLFIIRDGHTEWVLNTSTGNGEPYEEEDRNTPGEIVKGVATTPDGLFNVNRERPEGWWEGDLGKIYRPKYFNGGIAVHGSGSVPNTPASHGCVRVSVQAMDFIWAENLVPLRTPVWVYGTVPQQ